MVEFETIKSEDIPFGNNNFIEIARKKAKDGERETEFISISRGFFAFNGEKRFKTSVTVPQNPDVIDFITKKLKEI